MFSLKEHHLLKKNRLVQLEVQQNSQFPGGGKNPDLLQEEEENVAKETNDDDDVNAEANKTNDKKKDMAVTIK